MALSKEELNRRHAARQSVYQASPEQKKIRAERNAARAEMKKKLGAAAIAGKDIDHKHPIRNGGGNSAGNLRVRSEKANRSWRKGKKGYD